MKDFFNRVIEWISKNPLVEKFGESEFTRGIIIGFIVGILFLLLIRLILWICLRRKSCSCIEIKNPSGMITISTPAIASVIKAAVKPLESLTVNKVKLFKRKSQFDIYLRAALDPAKGSIPQLMEKLDRIVRDQMNEVFGVENIREVRLNVVSCKRDAAGMASDDPAELVPGDSRDKFSGDNDFASLISIRPPIEK